MAKIGFLFFFLVGSVSFAASHTSPFTMPCYEPFSTFAGSPGVIGTSCKASVIGDTQRVLNYYKNYIFNFEKYLRAIEPTYYTRTYLDNTLALLEQVATDFYKERAALEKRTVSAAELAGWINAVMAVAYQESLMTHFQYDLRPAVPSEKIQVLVGDAKCKKPWEVKDGKYTCPEFEVNPDGKKLYGSIGMYQIMLSVHSGNSKLGFFDVVHNIEYGMSFSYISWNKIIKGTHNGLAKCRDEIFSKTGAVNYINAARSMYSVYNGGPSRVCRWTEETIWKQNDNGYKYSIENRPWERVASPKIVRESRKVNGRYVFPFDLKCIRDGRALCLKTAPFEEPAKVAGQLFINRDPKTQEDRFCTWSDELSQYVCVQDEKAAACLQHAQKEWLPEFEQSRFQAPGYELMNTVELSGDAETLCSSFTDKIIPVGSEMWWPAFQDIHSWAEDVMNVQDNFYYALPIKILGFEARPGYPDIWYRFEYFKNNIRHEGWGVL